MIDLDREDRFLHHIFHSNLLEAKELLQNCDEIAKERILSSEFMPNYHTPLQYAVAMHWVDFVSFLLIEGDQINRINSIGLTTLNVAVGSNVYCSGLVDLLLNMGANTTPETYRRTLELVLEKGSLKNLAQLIRNQNPRVHGETILLLFQHKINELLIPLVQSGAIFPNQKFEGLSQFSLIELSVLTKNEELLRALLEKTDENFDFTVKWEAVAGENHYYDYLCELPVFPGKRLEEIEEELDPIRCERFLLESDLFFDDPPDDRDIITSTLGGLAYLVNFDRGLSLIHQHHRDVASRNRENYQLQIMQYSKIIIDILMYGTKEQLEEVIIAVPKQEVGNVVDAEIVYTLLGEETALDKISFLIKSGLNPNLVSESSSFSMAALAVMLDRVDILDLLVNNGYLVNTENEILLSEGADLEERFLESRFVGGREIGDVLRGEFDIDRARFVLENSGQQINDEECTLSFSLLQLAYIFQADQTTNYLLNRFPSFRNGIGLGPKNANNNIF